MKAQEHELQKACIKWFRYEYPHLGSLLFAIPNGGHRHIAVAAKMKAEGVQPGVPDLFLADPQKKHHGLFIEMKTPGGHLTPSQERMIGQLRDKGYRCEVCRSSDEFMEVVNSYLK